MCASSVLEGGMGKGSIPMEKFLGRASNSGFLATLVGLLAPNGAAAGFFPVPFLTGGWSLRRGHQSRVTTATVDNTRLPGALMLGTSSTSPASASWPSRPAEKKPSRMCTMQSMICDKLDEFRSHLKPTLTIQ